MITRRSAITLVLAGMAAALLVLSASLCSSYFNMRSGLARERVTPLCVIECDLSRASEFQAQFRLDYPHGHGFKLLVDGSNGTSDRFEPERWLGSLQGRVVVTRLVSDSDGELAKGWRAVELLPGNTSFASGPDSRALARLPAGRPGVYKLDFSITAGAAELAATPHRLIVMNDVCGCELMAGFISLVVGLGLGALGLIALATMGLRLRRPRVTSRTESQINSTSAAPSHT